MPSQEPPSDARSDVDLPPDDAEDADGSETPFLTRCSMNRSARDDPSMVSMDLRPLDRLRDPLSSPAAPVNH